MTYSVFQIDANGLSPSGCAAYTYALNAFQPYLRAPWYQFSEQAVDNPAINGKSKHLLYVLSSHPQAAPPLPSPSLQATAAPTKLAPSVSSVCAPINQSCISTQLSRRKF